MALSSKVIPFLTSPKSFHLPMNPRKLSDMSKRKLKVKGAQPTNPALYSRVKAEAKRKFDVYPSAYANAWLVRTYKKRGGGYKS